MEFFMYFWFSHLEKNMKINYYPASLQILLLFLCIGVSQSNATPIETAKSDSIVRFYGDSVGIGYISNGVIYLNNLDTLNFRYDDGEIRYKMSHCKIEGHQGNYELLMFGVSSNKSQIWLSFPCFVLGSNNNKNELSLEKYTHNITGNLGPYCNFSRTQNGQVEGCACTEIITSNQSTTNYNCNHTISTSTGKEQYQKYILDYNKYSR
jgi:hypothetical protein